MKNTFTEEYKGLRGAQKEAVDTIDGPVLVIAGPGTGKTQLLAVRVANILDKAAVDAGNILCLTFTDSAALNMRERLLGIIGPDANHVAIHTFHSFGVEIINQYPEHFEANPLLTQIDELRRYELARSIFDRLPASNPLSSKVGDDYTSLKDTLAVISWLKHNALTPHELHDILTVSEKAMQALTPASRAAFADTPAAKYLPKYRKLLEEIRKHTGEEKYGFVDFARLAADTLEAAIAETDPARRYAKPVTAWRDEWLARNARKELVWRDAGAALYRLRAVAHVYEELQKVMAAKGLYDFDDMVIKVVHALETDAELRYNLQERYQYLLVDEFQDTNKAQLRMIRALASHEVNEGKPNVLVVGDDDQAIYAFQGAEASNMRAFLELFPATEIYTLTESFRSPQELLDASRAVIQQAEDRLEDELDFVNKTLHARGDHAKAKPIRRVVLQSELSEYAWVAGEIRKLLGQGAEPRQIAVLSPRHKQLERLMPYLAEAGVPVAYERRENIFDQPHIRQLLAMAELTVAVAGQRLHDSDALLAEVLSYPFWGIPPEKLWEVSRQSYTTHRHWFDILLEEKKSPLADIAGWFLDLAKRSGNEPLEYILDELTGSLERQASDTESDESEAATQPPKRSASPYRAYYFSEERFQSATSDYLHFLGQLTTLRTHLREWQNEETLHLGDLVRFAQLYRRAELKLIDTNPHTQSADAVQAMTVYKAKGLEFAHVFAINCQDEIWGSKARGRGGGFRLPPNLPIQPPGNRDGDKLRALYVALTRAKHELVLSGYRQALTGRESLGLGYLGTDEEPLHEALRPQDAEAEEKPAEILQTHWSQRHLAALSDKAALLAPRLEEYRLSATHLNNFIDIVDAGPNTYFMQNLLRFPQAITPNAAYGDAMHKVLQWLYGQLVSGGKLPSAEEAGKYFADLLRRKHLYSEDFTRYLERGKAALELYLQQRAADFSADHIIEHGFKHEGVVLGSARLTGNIDKLVPGGEGELNIYDFKTGKPHERWYAVNDYEKRKLHKYRQQLMFYQLLTAGSSSYGKKYRAGESALVFVEADEEGRIVPPLALKATPEEMERFSQLIQAVWLHIQELSFPDTSGYAQSLKGIEDFENDLIEGRV
jgi:DNA helicase-2/ATP-dependent DNA helicase PcrA